MEYEFKDVELLKEAIEDAMAGYCCDANDYGCFEVVVKINSDYGGIPPVKILSTKNTE